MGEAGRCLEIQERGRYTGLNWISFFHGIHGVNREDVLAGSRTSTAIIHGHDEVIPLAIRARSTNLAITSLYTRQMTDIE